MLKVQEIKELIRTLDQSSVDELNYEQNGMKIVLKKHEQTARVYEQTVEPIAMESSERESSPTVSKTEVEAPKAAPAVETTQVPTENTHTIISPMVGTFYAAPSPDSDPYVKKGDLVGEDSVVCIVEAMKLMNEIEAEVNGKIIDILAENGELVEYGQPLFVVETK